MTETTAVDSGSARPFAGTVSASLTAAGGDFVSRPVDALILDFAGIVGDFHAGLTRKTTSREPWYPRGTEIRNDRQLTIVSEEELAEVALLMDLPEIRPGWIGANLVLSGLPDLTLTPVGTRLFFAGGASLLIEGENAPCRVAGKSIGAHVTGRQGLDLLFPKLARHKRGLVASVERAGTIRTRESFSVHPRR